MSKDKNCIIVISRQYGSGGRNVGAKLAEDLGLSFYDRNIISLAAEETGLSEDFFEKQGEAITSPLSYLFSYGSPTGGAPEETLPVPDRAFIAQSKIVKEIATRGNCVIVGRCADYVLEGTEDFLSIYLYGSFDDRVSRVMKRNQIESRDEAVAHVKKIDRMRSSYYQHYTGRKWGEAQNYDLSLNSTVFGIDGTTAIIEQAAKARGFI